MVEDATKNLEEGIGKAEEDVLGDEDAEGQSDFELDTGEEGEGDEGESPPD